MTNARVFGMGGLTGLLLAGAASAQTTIYHLETPTGTVGYTLASAGDVDADGTPDLLVSPAAPLGGPGTVTLFSGADGTHELTVTNPATGNLFDHFGTAIGSAGDVNGDGDADVLIGDPCGAKSGFGDTGSIVVLSGRDGSTLYERFGKFEPEGFGTSVCGLGDVNGDGRGDFVVGADEWEMADGYVPGTGYATVFTGATGQRLHTFEGDDIGDGFGTRVAAAGDVDDDGVPDVLVGAPGTAQNGYATYTHVDRPGYARVLSGADWSEIHSFVGDHVLDRFGTAVSSVGDVDLDGFVDVAVGARGGPAGRGYVRVFSGEDGVELFTVRGLAETGFGTAMAGVGDLDGDGIGDLAVGASGDDRGGLDAGRVTFHRGSDGALLGSMVGDGPGDRLGIAVAAAGDVNDDGLDDVILGSLKDPAGGDGLADVVTLVDLALSSDAHLVSVATGGSVAMELLPGPGQGGDMYLVLGSASGTDPGFVLPGGVHVPLNPDAYFQATLVAPGAAPFTGFTGQLRPTGVAQAALTLPPLADPALVGLTLHHAFVAGDDLASLDFASNAVPVTLVD